MSPQGESCLFGDHHLDELSHSNPLGVSSLDEHHNPNSHVASSGPILNWEERRLDRRPLQNPEYTRSVAPCTESGDDIEICTSGMWSKNTNYERSCYTDMNYEKSAGESVPLNRPCLPSTGFFAHTGESGMFSFRWSRYSFKTLFFSPSLLLLL